MNTFQSNVQPIPASTSLQKEELIHIIEIPSENAGSNQDKDRLGGR
jgi:hypothetical protein